MDRCLTKSDNRAILRRYDEMRQEKQRLTRSRTLTTVMERKEVTHSFYLGAQCIALQGSDLTVSITPTSFILAVSESERNKVSCRPKIIEFLDSSPENDEKGRENRIVRVRYGKVMRSCTVEVKRLEGVRAQVSHNGVVAQALSQTTKRGHRMSPAQENIHGDPEYP